MSYWQGIDRVGNFTPPPNIKSGGGEIIYMDVKFWKCTWQDC